MSIKQAIEALEEACESTSYYDAEDTIGMRSCCRVLSYEAHADDCKQFAALAALRSMPEEPYAYAVYFPKEFREELVHDLNDLLDDLTNCEHTITELFATPHTEAVRMSEAEILALWSGSEVATRPVLGSKKVIAFARAVEQATAARLGVKMGDARHADQA